jgi:hypothetical protein
MTRLLLAVLLVSGGVAASPETISLYVRDRVTGEPVAGATVIVVTDSPAARTLVTDAQGLARIDVSSNQPTSLSVHSPFHGAQCIAIDSPAEQPSVTAELQRSVTFHGVVTGAGRGRVPSATVTLSYAADPSCRVHIVDPPVRADRNGRYVLRNVNPGRRFKLTFSAEGHDQVALESAGVLDSVVLADVPNIRGLQTRSGELNVALPARAGGPAK